MTKLAELYERDYTAWAQANAALLKAGCFQELDIEHLLEELSDMGKSEQRELENRLGVLLTHLLKWHYQYAQLAERWKEFDGRSWRQTIVHQRGKLAILLNKHPGMQRFWSEAVREAYTDARQLAALESGLAIETFPRECPYSDAQLLDQTFYPGVDPL